MAADDPEVFVSYSSPDRPVAEEVYRSLLKSGFRCWMAPHDITAGEKYPRAIVRAISSVQVFVLIYSSAANQSSHVEGEVNQAFNRNLPILPFRIENVKPSEDLEYFLGNYHWFDAFDEPWQNRLDELAVRVRRLVQRSSLRGQEPPPSPDEPASFEAVVRNPQQLCGVKVGSYVLQTPLGSGGSGLVYQARHASLGQTVCVKLFYPVRAELARVTAAMKRGLRGLAAVQHPNIIRIMDEGNVTLVGASIVYLAMELIRGEDLLHWTRSLPDDTKQDPQTWKRRLHVARQIALGMQAAHECRFLDEVGFEQTGVLHGDLKPSNILLRAGDSPVLLDFMLADLQRLVDPQWREQRRSESEQRLGSAIDQWHEELGNATGCFGTPGFMSWEQEQQGIVTSRTDIYSLGMTFCLLFFPNIAQDIDEIGFNHRDLGHGKDLKSILDPGRFDGSMRSSLFFGGPETIPVQHLLGRMIADDEQRRPPSMRAVAEELAEIEAGAS